MFERILKKLPSVAQTEQTKNAEKALKMKKGADHPDPSEPHYRKLANAPKAGQIKRTDIRASKSGTFVEGISRSRGNRSGDASR